MRSNSVRLNGTTIVLTLWGDQTYETIDRLVRDTKQHLRTLKNRGQSGTVLVDLRHMTSHNTRARLRAREFFRLDYVKAAFYAKDPLNDSVILYLAGRRRSRVRIFRTKAEAMSWLSDAAPTPPRRALLRRPAVLFIALMLVGCALTVALWMQARMNLQNERQNHTQSHVVQQSRLMHDRITTYLGVLYGFKGYMESGSYVDRKSFDNFFRSIDVENRVPGLEAVSFIRQVPAEQRDTVTAWLREDVSLPVDGPEYTIRSNAERPVYYPVVFREPVPPRADDFYGLDVGNYADRLRTLQKAEASRKPAASESLNLLPQNRPPGQHGFLIALSVTVNDGITSYEGFVTGLFDYKKLFDSLFASSAVPLTIKDNLGQQIYSKGTIDGAHVTTEQVIADKVWTLTTAEVSLNQSDTAQPQLIALAGLIATGLLLITFYNVLRSRRAAYSMAQDITEDLRNAERVHDMMIDSVRDYAIVMLDPHGKIVTWNRGAANIKGYSAEEVYGKSIEIFYPEAAKQRARQLLARAARTGSAEDEGWRVRKDGSQFWADVHIAALRDDDGQLVGYTKVTRDLTEQKHLESEREAFTAIATHELKTPLASVKAYAQVLQRRFAKAGDSDAAALLGKMNDQLNRLVRLTSDLLDVSKLATEKLGYNFTHFDFAQLVSTTVEELQRVKVSHVIKYDGPAQLELYGDQHRLHQVLANLLENAVKYSPNSDTVVANLESAKGKARFTVTDFGIGVPRAERKKVFERFYRTRRGRAVPGFGLGMYLSAEIIKQHGGRIWVTGEAGHSTSFIVELPVKLPKLSKPDS